MIARSDANRHAELGASLLAECDPLSAARVLAQGLRLQSRGGKLAVLRVLAQQLVDDTPGLASAIAAELAALQGV